MAEGIRGEKGGVMAAFSPCMFPSNDQGTRVHNIINKAVTCSQCFTVDKERLSLSRSEP